MNVIAYVFVEGIGDLRFFCDYLLHLDLADAVKERKDKRIHLVNSNNQVIVLQSVEGKDNILSFAPDMLRNNNENILNLIILDADRNFEERKTQIENDLNSKNILYHLFLSPNNRDPGALEDILENIINRQNQVIFDCWERYEEELTDKEIEWKTPKKPTSPAKKTKIYGYLEALHGETKAEKEKIKEAKRNYRDTNLWNLNADYLNPLKEWLASKL